MFVKLYNAVVKKKKEKKQNKIDARAGAAEGMRNKYTNVREMSGKCPTPIKLQ